jgi:hypothetical protein
LVLFAGFSYEGQTFGGGAGGSVLPEVRGFGFWCSVTLRRLFLVVCSVYVVVLCSALVVVVELRWW